MNHSNIILYFKIVAGLTCTVPWFLLLRVSTVLAVVYWLAFAITAAIILPPFLGILGIAAIAAAVLGSIFSYASGYMYGPAGSLAPTRATGHGKWILIIAGTITLLIAAGLIIYRISNGPF